MVKKGLNLISFAILVVAGLLVIFGLAVYIVTRVFNVGVDTFSTVYPFLQLGVVIIFAKFLASVSRSEGVTKSANQSAGGFIFLAVIGTYWIFRNQGIFREETITMLAFPGIMVENPLLTIGTKLFSGTIFLVFGLLFIVLIASVGFATATGGIGGGKASFKIFLPLIVIGTIVFLLINGVGAARGCPDGMRLCDSKVSVFEVTTRGEVSNPVIFGCLEIDLTEDEIKQLEVAAQEVEDVEVCSELSDPLWVSKECQDVGDISNIIGFNSESFKIKNKVFGGVGEIPRTYDRKVTATSPSGCSAEIKDTVTVRS